VNLSALRGHRRILVDTSVWIYHFEAHSALATAAGRIVEAIEDGRFEGVVSELTLLELAVRPLQLGRQDVADEYEVLLDRFPNLQLVPISRDILLEAASVRARHRLRTADAITLATGILHGATAAVTNDAGWRACSGIKTVLLSEMVSGSAAR